MWSCEQQKNNTHTLKHEPWTDRLYSHRCCTGHPEENHRHYCSWSRKRFWVEGGEGTCYRWAMNHNHFKRRVLHFQAVRNTFSLLWWCFRPYPKQTRGWWDHHRSKHPIPQHPFLWICLAKTQWQVMAFTVIFLPFDLLCIYLVPTLKSSTYCLTPHFIFLSFINGSVSLGVDHRYELCSS